VIAALAEGVILRDKDAHIIACNASAERILGRTLDQMRGNVYYDSDWHAIREDGSTFPDDERPANAALRTGKPQSEVTLGLRKPDGVVLWLSMNARPLFKESDPAPSGVVTTITNITERKQAAEQLKASNKELESFSYSVSHDLRSPLRAIIGYVRMLEEDHGARLDEDAKRCLAVVRKEAGRMAELIDDLLAFSRLGREQFKATAIDMTTLVQEVAAELRPTAGPAARIEVESLPPASCDRATLRQVWVNLIGNAIKYSGKCDQPRVRISGEKLQGETVYRIEDNGAGFDMRYYNKLFGVFQRLHSAGEFQGTGIGLAIVQRIVARHRGRVWAQGEPGRGAVFYFSLPSRANDNE
jgi:PAS domain S-box-containing protein